MDEQPKIVSGIMIPVQQMRGGIQFQNVSFAYPSKQAVQVIQKMDVDIKPGENVAIVGTSGSGKSTIVSLIERFYDITNGEILIDGVNIKELDWDWLHQNIGFVSQEPTLFRYLFLASARPGPYLLTPPSSHTSPVCALERWLTQARVRATSPRHRYPHHPQLESPAPEGGNLSKGS